jgi:hypothetical protein
MALSRKLWIAALLAALAGCSGRGRSGGLDALKQTELTLPGGQRIMAEMMMTPTDWQRGMMFRDALPADRGMLFLYGESGPHSMWMHNVRIPLDIVWLSRERVIVGIMANAPPCQVQNSALCPSYATREPSQFVLELAGGMAQKYGLAKGQRISF